jgi:short-subunit dehydrogenase
VDVRGKRVLITGAGHGLGREFALAFAMAGASIVVTDRDDARVQGTVAEIRGRGHDATGHALDVTNLKHIEDLCRELRRSNAPVDVLVNNAGVVFGGQLAEVTFERHRATIEVNLTGLVAMTRQFLPMLAERPQGAIVMIASAAALVPLPFAATYAATKAGVLAFADSLREELRVTGRSHVLVTTICPNFVSTGLFSGARSARLTWELSPAGVAQTVLKAVTRDRQFVLLPWSAAWLYIIGRALPRRGYHWLCRLLGVTRSMENWRGHVST